MLSKELLQKVMENAPGCSTYDPEMEWLNEHAPLSDQKQKSTVTIEIAAGASAVITVKIE